MSFEISKKILKIFLAQVNGKRPLNTTKIVKKYPASPSLFYLEYPKLSLNYFSFNTGFFDRNVIFELLTFQAKAKFQSILSIY